MKMKTITGTILLFAMTFNAIGADLTGRWHGKLGNMELGLNLKVEGKKLTGTIFTADGDGPISNGKLEGDQMELSMVYQEKESKGTLVRLKENESIRIPARMRPQMTEYWEPVPRIVDPGPYCGMVAPPSDAIVLFDGKDLSKWKSRDGSDAKWKVEDGAITVVKGTGDITTRQKFGDYQLHIEWKVPEDIQGQSQARGNSGVFLQDLSDDLKIPQYWYEVQVLDNFNNPTYVNGQAGSIYKQNPPLANVMRKPGEWNVYDITYTAPRFNEDGSLYSAARVTVLHNGVLVQNNFQIRGHTAYIGHPKYFASHGKAPISLQDHGDPSKAISFRNIWLREL